MKIIKTTTLKNNAGLTLVENLISLALLATVAVSISPVFVSSGKVSKGSSFRETCQRIVNAKISAYRSMTQAQLLARYNAYRAATADSAGSGLGSGWNKLCGFHPAQTFSTAFPAAAPSATGAPEAAIRANLVTFTNGSFGTAPALGVRECPTLSTTPGNDVLADTASAIYLVGSCSSAITVLPANGFKQYTSLAVSNPWGGTMAYSCPAATFTPTGLNQSIDVVVSAVADYASDGSKDVGGETDPNRLMCSARASIPIVSAGSSIAQFRYYAHSGVASVPGTWAIRKIGAGISEPGAGTPTPAQVYIPVSTAMNTWVPRSSGNITNGYVTQFGISPSGKKAFFVKAYESNSLSANDDYLTSYYCTLDLPNGESQSAATPSCYTLPRMSSNQIEYVMLDYQGGKMWGVLGRSMDPDRSSPNGGQDIALYGVGAVLIADCSVTNTTADTREAALFNFSGCETNPAVPVHFPGAAAFIYNSDPGLTDYNTRKLDMEYLLNSPDAMWGSTPVGSVSRQNHISARGLRDLSSMLGGNGRLYKIEDGKRDCFSIAPTPGAAKYICTRKAFARLFFSPDALSAYAVMRYPRHDTHANDPGTGSGTVTCPTTPTNAYDRVDKTVRIYKLELPNAAGSTDNLYGCPNVAATYLVGDSSNSAYRYILMSF